MDNSTTAAAFILAVILMLVCTIDDERAFLFRQKIPGLFFSIVALGTGLMLAWRNLG